MFVLSVLKGLPCSWYLAIRWHLILCGISHRDILFIRNSIVESCRNSFFQKKRLSAPSGTLIFFSLDKNALIQNVYTKNDHDDDSIFVIFHVRLSQIPCSVFSSSDVMKNFNFTIGCSCPWHRYSKGWFSGSIFPSSTHSRLRASRWSYSTSWQNRQSDFIFISKRNRFRTNIRGQKNKVRNFPTKTYTNWLISFHCISE